MTCPAIDDPTSCKIRAIVIRFLHAKITSAVEKRREVCATVYGQNIMSEGTVRHRCRIFTDGRTNAHDEEQSGRQATCSE
jgi:hypothetical protein